MFSLNKRIQRRNNALKAALYLPLLFLFICVNGY
jgi:hypothetical protein